MKKSSLIIVAAFALLLLFSCKKEAETPVPSLNGTRITVMNTCIGSGEVTAEFKGIYKPLTQRLNYLNNSGYFAIAPGHYNLNFFMAPYPKELANTYADFEKDKHYFAIVTGVVGRARIIITENEATLPAKGKARIRFINLSPDSSMVDITSNNSSLFTDIDYKQTSSYKEVNVGNINIAARKHADGNNLSQNSFTLEEQKNYTILLVGTKDGSNEEGLHLKLVKY